MTVTIRSAVPGDAPEMVALLNRIIEIGGTTAHQTPMTNARMIDHYIAPKLAISCFVALSEGKIVGFQALERSDPNWNGPDKRPAGWGMIASFVADGMQGNGIGNKLFSETLKAARAENLIAIDATIRADNKAGLAFYEKSGFREDSRLKDVPLSNGVKVDRIRKVYTL